jgi:ABC-type branched-subunit amino acid transport system permease subunit
MLAYGVVLIVCVFFLPRGIVPSVAAAIARRAPH